MAGKLLVSRWQADTIWYYGAHCSAFLLVVIARVTGYVFGRKHNHKKQQLSVCRIKNKCMILKAFK